MVKSSRYLKKEGWIEGMSGEKYRKISERPICVCNLTGTTHFITGTIKGRKLAGEIVFRHTSFCSDYGKSGSFRQGVYNGDKLGYLIG